MEFALLSVEAILYLHNQALNEGELQGLAGDKSLGSAVARVENRLNYGLIRDVCHLAATYGVVIPLWHVFNDGNKRTAFSAMEICLAQNGVTPSYDVIEAADMIIQAAQGIVDEAELGTWLRGQG